MPDQPDMREAALRYASQGLKIIPCCWVDDKGECVCGKRHTYKNAGKAPLTPHGLSDASSDPDQIEKWWTRWPEANIGILASHENGFWVLDVDKDKGGLESLAALEQEHGKLTTRLHHTGGGGKHFLFRYPQDTPIGTKPNICAGIETRADGAYIIAPPSLHRSGKRYLADEQTEIEDAPDWLVEMIPQGSSARIGLMEPVAEGERDIAFASLAGIVRALGGNESEIYSVLRFKNSIPGQDPKTDKDLRRIAKSIAKKPAGSIHQSDTGNALVLVDQYGDILRFDHIRRRWLCWGSHHWEVDEDGFVYRLAQEVAQIRYMRAMSMKETDEYRKKALSWAVASENRYKIDSCIYSASKMKPIADSGRNWDEDDMLLGAPNGVIDLRTGDLRDGKPEDRITMSVGTDFDPKAECPIWLEFLSRVTDGDDDLQGFLQRSVGYSLTGQGKQQVWFIMYGEGNNGKSTFLVTVRKLLGDYGCRASTDLFMRKERGGHKEGLANLEGKRFVGASELEQGQRLSEALIKEATGGETLMADRKYEHEREFQARFKIWLSGNHMPKIKDDTLATWRRIKRIPFIVTIPNDEIDTDLPEKLEAELPGILNWAIEGCLTWQKEELGEPECVTRAVREYREEQDNFSRFIRDNCTEDPNETTLGGIAFSKYKLWASSEGIEVAERLSKNEFGDKMKKRFRYKHKDSGMRYFGVKLNLLVDLAAIGETPST